MIKATMMATTRTVDGTTEIFVPVRHFVTLVHYVFSFSSADHAEFSVCLSTTNIFMYIIFHIESICNMYAPLYLYLLHRKFEHWWVAMSNPLGIDKAHIYTLKPNPNHIKTHKGEPTEHLSFSKDWTNRDTLIRFLFSYILFHVVAPSLMPRIAPPFTQHESKGEPWFSLCCFHFASQFCAGLWNVKTLLFNKM